jgi:uncharacterized LabA/DUF88 family protein
MSPGLRYAVLIVGGFARYALRKPGQKSPITAADVQNFLDALSGRPELEQQHLYRVYYYDAVPLEGSVRRADGYEWQFTGSAMQKISQSQHATFSRLPMVAMRFGELSVGGWKVKDWKLKHIKPGATFALDDLEPNVQQKGVDMRIGLDIAPLTLKRQVGPIVLLTGDSDLVPAMKFARREGAQLVLATQGHGVKDGMFQHADVVISDRL